MKALVFLLNILIAIGITWGDSVNNELSALPEVEEQAAYPMCDVRIEGSICLNDGQKVLLPPARQYGLIGFYNMDDDRGLDHSGRQNHAISKSKPATFPGPAFGGVGSSALFRQSYLTIPHSPDFETPEFSYTFWLFMLREVEASKATGPKWCPLIMKGFYDKKSKEYVSAPTIMYNVDTRHLRPELTTSVNGRSEAQQLTSNARIRKHAWTHVGLVRHGSRLRLYVNGILDASSAFAGSTEHFPLPLYVGSAPGHESCDVPLLMDEFKIYNRPLGLDELQAEAAPALAGVESSYVKLSCLLCPLDVAIKGCPEGWHICSNLQLNNGGLHVAVRQDYVKPGTSIWTREGGKIKFGGTSGVEAAEAHSTDQALGLCCADLV
eukprot:Platyproteum_vivax@DN16198_c0_g1_i1.p1